MKPFIQTRPSSKLKLDEVVFVTHDQRRQYSCSLPGPCATDEQPVLTTAGDRAHQSLGEFVVDRQIIILNDLDSLEPKVVHRDIKPANIFVKGGSCVLGDFGPMRLLSGDDEEDRSIVKESIGVGMPRFYRTPDLVSYFKEESVQNLMSFSMDWFLRNSSQAGIYSRGQGILLTQ